MIDMTWTATPAPFAGALAARPVGAGDCATAVTYSPAAAPAPNGRTRLPATRLRALMGGMPFGAGTDELHVMEQSTKNDPTLGLQSPGRPLS